MSTELATKKWVWVGHKAFITKFLGQVGAAIAAPALAEIKHDDTPYDMNKRVDFKYTKQKKYWYRMAYTIDM